MHPRLLTTPFYTLHLVRLGRRKRFDGDVILAYTFLYAIARFILEFYRGDGDRGFVFGGALSTSQFIAAILGPVAIGLWLVRRSNKEAERRGKQI